MKLLCCVSMLFSLTGTATAEQCVTRTGEYQGRSLTYQTCDAPIEQVFTARVDGYRFTAYVVTLQGQRVVVSDTLSRTNHNVGDQVSFLVAKYDLSGEAAKSFSLEVIEPEPKPAPETK